MKIKDRKQIIQRTIGVIVVTLIITLLANLFRFSAQEAVINATVSEMEQIGAQMQIILEDAIIEAEIDLSLLSEYASKNNISKENAVDFLDSQSQTEKFNNLFYVDLEGNGINVEGKTYDFSQYSAFHYATEKDSHITNPYISAEKEEFVFKIFVPVTQNNEVTAVLCAEIIISDFFEIMKENTGEVGDIFIVDEDLNFIFSTSEGHEGEVIIPDGDVNEMGYENVIEAQFNITNNNSGSFHYDYYGISKVMTYMPINMTDWALAINVESAYINNELAEAVDKLNDICVAIYWFLIVVICVTAYDHNRNVRIIEEKAYYDELTKLPNLTKIKLDMSEILNQKNRGDYGVLKFDIENFKIINEIFGFEVGDKVLKVAKNVSDDAKKIEKELIVARIGVDEYLTFAPAEFILNVENNIAMYESEYKKIVPEIGNYKISFKYGRYIIEKNEIDISQIINKVTLAHNKAKESEGFSVYDYDELYKNKLLKDARIASKMHKALENNEFKVYLQPKFNTKDNTLIGAEALVRWIEEDGTIIFPDDFIPLFEKNGFIVEIDKYILDKVSAFITSLIDRNMGHLPISVNCSRQNLKSQTFVEDIVYITDKNKTPHNLIEIELTESTTLDNEKVLVKLFSKLTEHEFKISIDDFGSGYSSLGMLQNLKVDTLKLDRSFFSSQKKSGRRDLLVRSVIDMSHNLGMYVVAEGIETLEQIETLRSMNCDAVQGYYFARPMPMEIFEEKYKDVIPN